MNNNIIQGNPTKTFFIDMITRDISIRDAIVDLLDNSIDGAKKLNSSSYEGLYINITINKEKFVVEDNCGGFSIETAKQYAFRFGRPEEAPDTTGSIGRFGIGMKRALFKIGKQFIIESKHMDDHFMVNVDVESWKQQMQTVSIAGRDKTMEDWSFSYKLVSSGNITNNGTYISVTELLPEVSEIFGRNDFLNNLRDDIERLLNFSLEKKIKITLNGQVLSNKSIQIYVDNEFTKPYVYDGKSNDVSYKIVAGLGDVGEPTASGWYIYCNDRLIIEADQTEITGWGKSPIPKWHPDYVMFRGVVFIDSEETLNLPLTTTKKGIDTTADIYKIILAHMSSAIINVIPFLKNVVKLTNPNDYRNMIAEKVTKLGVVNLKSIDATIQKQFIAPELDLDDIASKKDSVRIAYDMPKSKANAVKNYSGAKNYKEVGVTSFEYYVTNEEIEYE